VVGSEEGGIRNPDGRLAPAAADSEAATSRLSCASPHPRSLLRAQLLHGTRMIVQTPTLSTTMPFENRLKTIDRKSTRLPDEANPGNSPSWVPSSRKWNATQSPSAIIVSIVV